MKAIVKTSKSIVLMDPLTKDVIEEHRPVLVNWTQFIQARVGQGEIVVLAGDLPSESSSEEFDEFWAASEGNEELAIESFLSSFGEPESEEKPKGKKKTPAKAKE